MRPYLNKETIKMILECVSSNDKYKDTILAANLIQQLLPNEKIVQRTASGAFAKDTALSLGFSSSSSEDNAAITAAQEAVKKQLSQSVITKKAPSLDDIDALSDEELAAMLAL